ncbi:MAG: ATP-binding protein, partial [Thermosynechococcaceae cyanobacterium]
ITLHLTCEEREEQEHPQQVILQVQDTGPGIKAEEQALIFERFRQGAYVSTGSGLGLHLASQIVMRHQGKITLQSEVGQGSTFTVALPRQPL